MDINHPAETGRQCAVLILTVLYPSLICKKSIHGNRNSIYYHNMAGNSLAAGPEWAYLAPLTTSTGVLTDLDSLLVNVIVERKKPKPKTETKVLNLQTLISRQGNLYGPHDVTRFSFSRFRDLTETWDLDLFFYEGTAKQGVAIPDESAFQRLLLAVRHLGIGAPLSPINRASSPPVMKFFAQPKPPARMHALVAALLLILILFGIAFIFGLIREFGPGPVIVWSLVLLWVADAIFNPQKRQNAQPRRDGMN